MFLFPAKWRKRIINFFLKQKLNTTGIDHNHYIIRIKSSQSTTKTIQTQQKFNLKGHIYKKLYWNNFSKNKTPDRMHENHKLNIKL